MTDLEKDDYEVIEGLDEDSEKENPFASTQLMNNEGIVQGAVTIETGRAIADTQMKMQIAKQFPRNYAKVYENIMQSCKRKGLADIALYSFPKGKDANGKSAIVSGMSIRLAEELARCWTNLDYGLKELSNVDGESEMMAFCWDLESNVKSSQTFVVKHKRDSKWGTKDLKDQRDIYEITANMGARRLRSRILAIIPSDIQIDAVNAIKKTIHGSNDADFNSRIKQIIQRFNAQGVRTTHLEEYLGHKIEDMLKDEFINLNGIFNALKDGTKKASDYFTIHNKSDLNDQVLTND